MEHPDAVLWVTDEVPDVDGTGGSIRQAHLLRAVAEVAPVDLLLAADRVPDEVAALVREIRLIGAAPNQPPDSRLRTVTAALLDPEPEDVRGGRPGMRRLDAALGGRAPYGTVVVQHVWLADLIRHRRAGERWILDLHYLPSVRSRQAELTAETWKGRVWCRLDRRKAARHERRALARYDEVVVPSPGDASVLRSSRISLVPNGVDLERYRPAPIPREPRVVFTGHLRYPPNVDALTWFTRAVWPTVRARVHEARLQIVGFAPGEPVRALAGRDGVEVVADVASTVPHLHAARAAIVPVRIGSGTRLKALEALACARPVVGTSIGLDGLDLRDGVTACVVDDEQGFAAAVVDVLVDDEAAERLGEAGRQHVAERFSWPVLAARFASLVTGPDP